MLNPDEHRAPIRRHEHTGNFALRRTHEKASGLSGVRMRRQHLVVAETDIGTDVNGGS